MRVPLVPASDPAAARRVAPEAPRVCPQCGSGLQRLYGAEGYAVEPVVSCHGGPVFERRKVSVIYACPRCEHIEEGR